MISLLQTIFGPPEQLLSQAIAYLAHLSTVAAAGLHLETYFGWFSVLDPAWEGVVSSLMGSVVLIGVLQLVRSVYRLYLSLKRGVKWW